MSKAVVLDASALIASIYTEKGATIIDRYLPHALISTVNLTEVASYMIRQGVPIEEVSELLKDLSLDIIAYDEEQALLAGELLPKASPKGLSLGDRACLALGLSKKLPVLTGDKVWKSLDLDVKIELFR